MSTEYREIVEDLTNHGEEDLEQTDPLNVTYMLEDFDDLQKKKLYFCELCNIQVTSSNVLRRHKEGRKHQMRAERQGKTFACELCEITANSQSQLDAHLRSTKHKARLTKKDNPLLRLNRNTWITIFCVLCALINVFIFFKLY